MVKKMKLLETQQPKVTLKFSCSQEFNNSQPSEEGNLELTISQQPENYSPWSSISKLTPLPQKNTDTPISLRKSLFSSSKYSSGSESAEALQIQTREEQDREILKMQQMLDLLESL